MGPRTITVWCPDWEIVAADCDPASAAGVFRAHRVVARTPVAAAAGVVLGQRRRLAQRSCPHMDIVDHDLHRDARRFEPIMRAVSEIAPRIEVVRPGWLQIAARGPSRYFGGEVAVAHRLLDVVTTVEPQLRVGRLVAHQQGVLARVGAGVGVGVADGQAAAGVAAQLAARTLDGVLVVDEGETARFLAPLPIGWLARVGVVQHELIELFVRLGVTRCGDLAGLDVEAVVARFGVEGLRAHRVVSATDTDLLAPTEPPVDHGVEHTFDTPVEQLDTVVFIGKRLADQLVETLRREGRVCVCIEITVSSEHGERSQRLWYRNQGMNAAAMVERLRWQLEGWVSERDGVSGGVATVKLLPVEVRADDGYQVGMWGERTQADHDAARAITRLIGIAGDHSVLVPEWVGGRLPAERFRWVPASEVDLERRSGSLIPEGGPWPGSGVKAASVVYADPIPVAVSDEHGRLLQVSGRGEMVGQPVVLSIEGEVYRVAGWAGPWPVEQRWWDHRHARRIARLQLITVGGSGFLVGVERGKWLLLASYL